jgi:CheY-like chemotaxis protein/signal transduction histidine kinase/HAMP domain-containing protein
MTGQKDDSSILNSIKRGGIARVLLFWLVGAALLPIFGVTIILYLELQQNVVLIGSILAAILVIFAAAMVTRSIVRPMLQLSRCARNLAIGNLIYEQISSSIYEIKHMDNDFKELIDSRRLITSVCKEVAGGDLSHTVFVRSEEDGLCTAINQIIENLRNVVHQAVAIASGNYSLDILPHSDNDELGVALSHMTLTLRQVTAENDKQAWLKTGLNQLYDTIKGEQDLIELSQNIIGFLSNYVGAQVGAFFLQEQDKFKLVASFAYTKRKHIANSYAPGEGLVGQAALEKKSILITGVPDDYVKINSGLGESAPRNLIVVPAVYEGEVKAVIELGTFHELTDIQVDFMQQSVSSIAIAINTSASRSRLKVLVEERQQQSEELQVQQEELRQTNEELEEQARALRDSEAKLQVQQEELRQTNEELEEKNRYLEKQQNDIKKKNEELEYSRRMIEEKARDLELSGKYKSEFLANMSHELRTPLNSLLILSRLLYENKESNLTEKQVEFARTIHSSGSDLLELINDILDLSKIEAGKVDLFIQDLDIADLAGSVERNLRHMAEEKGLTFDIELSQSMPSIIRTDRQRLEQIIKNLLSNAIKFTSQGSICLKIGRPYSEAKLMRNDLDIRNTVAFTVSDTGIGIAADKMKLIFEPFQQADGTTSRQYGGTGLGLSISRELVRCLGGEIQLESREGYGSTFTIYLPEILSEQSAYKLWTVKKDAADKKVVRTGLPEAIEFTQARDTKHIVAEIQEQQLASRSAKDQLKDNRLGVSVLIIEDDPRFSAILVDLAGGKGFHVYTAADGETGLQFALKYRPSAIILDVGLPDIDGWAVMERLKGNPETRHIPVHFISAYDSGLDAMRMGAIGYLTKPVSMEVLDGAFNKIQDIISKNIKKLLVVEDDELQQRSILELIGEGDVMTTAVGSGYEAFELLRTGNFDCIVLDLGLRDMSGFDLLEKIRNHDAISHIPVIIYTGKDLTKEEEAILSEHAESIIIKGVKSPERLLDETTLFLHRVEANLSEDSQKMLQMIHNKEMIFQNKKILLIDDDMRNVFALMNVLEEKGMKVLVGKNGKEGIFLLEDNPDVDLILMDIMMPEMDGYEAMKEIRKQNKFKLTPIIALTAKAMVGDRSKCIEAGASDYLSKPIDTDKLLSLLRVWLYR